MPEYLSVLVENSKKDVTELRDEVKLLLGELKAGATIAREFTNSLSGSSNQRDLSDNFNKAVSAASELKKNVSEYAQQKRQLAEEERRRAAEERELNRLIAKEASDLKKKQAQEERELNKLIAAEQRVLEAKSKDDRRRALAERKQAEKEYQDTWKQLLNERDRLAQEQAQRQKKAAADAAAAVAGDSLVGLRKTLSDATIGFDRLTRAERENAEIGGVLKSRIQELNKEISANEQGTGRFQRNVGNYSGATANLQFSIQQIARELPSISNGFATFASAIGNNIAPAVDALGKFRKEQALLRAEGKPTQSAFAAITSSIFSFQTLLLVGVTLLTVYGKEIGEVIKELVQGKKVFTDIELAAKGYSDTIKESSRNIAEVSGNIADLKARFTDAKASVEDKKMVIEELNKAYGDTIGNIKGINEAEKFFAERSDAYVRAVTLRAQAEGARSIIAKNTQEQLEREAKSVDEAQSGWRKYAATLQATFKTGGATPMDFAKNIGKVRDQMLQEDKELKDMAARGLMDRANTQLSQMILGWEREATAIQKIYGFNFVKDPKTPKSTQPRDTDNESRRLAALQESSRLSIEGQLFRQEQIQRINQTILDDETQSYQDRLAAQAAYEEASREIQRLNSSKELIDVKAKIEGLKKQDADYQAGRIKMSKYDHETLLKELENARTQESNLTARSEDEKNKIIEEGVRRRIKLQQDENQNTINAVVSGLKATAAYYADYYREEEAKLKRQFGNSRIYREKERELRLRVDQQIQADQLKNLEEAINILRAEGIDVQKLVDVYNQLASAKNKSGGNNNVFGISSDTLAQLQNGYQYLTDAAKSANDIFNAQTENRINGINKEIEAINKRKETLLLEAEAQGLSDEELARKKKEINDQAAAQQAQQEEKLRAERTAAARREKAVAIGLAAIKGILFVLNSSSIPEAIIRGALVAAQVAAIAATDIPAYAEGAGIDGRPLHKGGKALTGEGGEPELIIEPGKNPYVVDKPTLKHLNAGTRVIPQSKMNERVYQSIFGITPRERREHNISVKGIENRLDMWGARQVAASRGNRNVIIKHRFDPLLFNYANR